MIESLPKTLKGYCYRKIIRTYKYYLQFLENIGVTPRGKRYFITVEFEFSAHES
jgi:hypothetical protein